MWTCGSGALAGSCCGLARGGHALFVVAALPGFSGLLELPAFRWSRHNAMSKHNHNFRPRMGTKLIPCDFIGFFQTPNSRGDHRDLLMSNVFE